MLSALARFTITRTRWIVAAAGAVAVVGVTVGGPVVGKLTASATSFQDPASESVRATHIVERSGAQPSPGVIALIRLAEPVDAQAARAKVARIHRIIAADPKVSRVVGYAGTGDPAFVSNDRRSTYLAGFLRPGVDDVKELQARLSHEPGVLLGGAAVASTQGSDTVSSDLARAEMLAFPILAVLLVLVFRSAVAALLPLMVGAMTIVTTFVGLRLVNAELPLSVFAVNLVTGLGLGLAIDYSLLLVSRFREELVRGDGEVRSALRRTLTTAGRTILFSALTVAAALAALTVFPERFLYSMGIGGTIVALTAAAIALVVLPAVMALLGHRVNALAPRRLRESGLREAQGVHGVWYRLSRGVMARPARIAIGASALLLALGTPFLGVRFTGFDATVLPTSTSARQVNDALETQFPPNRATPVIVAVDAPGSAGPALAAYADRIQSLPGTAAVARPAQVAPGTWRIDVVSRTAPLASGSKDLVHDIRGLPLGYPHAVGGQTANFLDLQSSLADRLPLALALLAATTVVLLFLVTGSVVLPLKSILMNVLSISAAFGILVVVFQDGHLQGPLGFTSQGALESTQPILLLMLAFGLSTDYAVFLLTRIKEAHDAGAPNEEAVALGLERSGRIVTAAALLFSVAVGAFSTSRMVFIKELGVGTALAVLLDATIVRALLVPSLMRLLGDWNWWAPAPLRRLHRSVGIREGAPAPRRPGENVENLSA